MDSVFLYFFWLKQETEIKQSNFIKVENNLPKTSKGGNKATLKLKHTGADWTLAQGQWRNWRGANAPLDAQMWAPF